MLPHILTHTHTHTSHTTHNTRTYIHIHTYTHIQTHNTPYKTFSGFQSFSIEAWLIRERERGACPTSIAAAANAVCVHNAIAAPRAPALLTALELRQVCHCVHIISKALFLTFVHSSLHRRGAVRWCLLPAPVPIPAQHVCPLLVRRHPYAAHRMQRSFSTYHVFCASLSACV